MESSAILETNYIFGQTYLITARMYMSYANSALITNICVRNTKNKITQNVSNFCNHGNQTIEPSAILQKKCHF